MNGTDTDVRRAGRLRRRRLTLSALLALVATLAATMLVANPASAAAVCGNFVRARVSLQYKACNAPGPNPGTIRITVIYINGHGSPVDDVTYQIAYKIDGHLTGDPWVSYAVFDWDQHLRPQRLPDAVDYCQVGKYVSFAFRIKENDGSAGPWSVAPPILCTYEV